MSSGCVAPIHERQTEIGLIVATEVAKLIRQHRDARKVFNIALRDIHGFKDLYALRIDALRAVDRFTMAYKDDVKHWLSLGHTKEFSGAASFGRFRTKLSALAAVPQTTTVEEGEERDEDTEESSDFDEAHYEDLKKRKTWYEKEVERLENKKSRHEIHKRLDELDAEKVELEEKLRMLVKK